MADANKSKAVKFTEPQNQAIETSNKTLLVSAGAGSGKTSVLTERIIRRITDRRNLCDITDFLVVTFTKASANDLKSKISKAINENLSHDFNNNHLKRQQLILGRANISTIHSFYLELVHNNFEKLGLPAKFRLADESEISVIRRRISDNLLEEYYNPESDIYKSANFSCQDFIAAVENFIGSRDDANIYNVILKIYGKLNSLVNRFEIFEKQIAMMGEIENFNLRENNNGFFETAFGRFLKGLFGEKIDICLRELAELLERTEDDSTLSKKYTPAFSNRYEFLSSIKHFVQNGCNYDVIYDLCTNYSKVSIGRQKLDDDNLKNFFKERNDIISKKIEEIKKYFEYEFSDIKRFAKTYKTIISIIYDFIRRFEASMLAEKTKLKSFEFADLEHFAFELLVVSVDGDGTVHETDLARQLKDRFKEIYIDEYQDTNKLQDTIFKAISNENSRDYSCGNRFMVGDIKQSIYAFRGAKSDIFAVYSKLFKENSPDVMPQKIYLRDNFRSSYNVIGFINYIFGELFSEKLGGVEYTGGEVLSCGKESAKSESVDTIFALIEKDISSNTTGGEDDDVGNEDENEDEDNGGIISAEAEYIALTVKNLLTDGKLKNGEKILPRHIAILMRNMSESGVFIETLKKYGIPCYTDKAKGFLESAEIMLMISMLKTIDNPHTDIPLAAVLKSPVFSFTLDDLIYLKNFHEVEEISKKEYLYYYIKSFAEKNIESANINLPIDETVLQDKCRGFLEKLRSWRLKSRTMTVDKFIWYLYRQTDIIAKVTGGSFSDERMGNLLLLHEYARQFETTSFNGLHGFLNYIDDVRSGQDDFEKVKISSENSDVVRVMSIHKSKGLEFPVCILACTGKKFNTGDYTNDPIISEDCGIYFNLKCDDGIGIEKTTFKKAAADKIKSEMLSEEARILYVALTRAIEKLIIAGSSKNIVGFMAKNTIDDGYGEIKDGFKRAILLSEADCALKWLTPIILNSDGKNRTGIKANIDIVTKERLDSMISAVSGIDDADADQASETTKAAEDNINAELEAAHAEEADRADKYETKIREMYDFAYPQKFLSKIPAKLSVSKLHPGILDNDEYVQKNDEMTLLPLPRFLEDADNINNIANNADENIDGDATAPAYNPALTGIAMHLFMQFADFENAEKYGVKTEAENLMYSGFISDIQFARLNFNRLNRFFSSATYKKIKLSKNIFREMRFNLKLPASEFSESGAIRDSGEYILIQGVIDLFYIDESGGAVVVDFKTDSVKKDGGEAILIERHRQQIEYYCLAAEKILNKPVSGAYIYSFSLGKEIEIELEKNKKNC